MAVEWIENIEYSDRVREIYQYLEGHAKKLADRWSWQQVQHPETTNSIPLVALVALSPNSTRSATECRLSRGAGISRKRGWSRSRLQAYHGHLVPWVNTPTESRSCKLSGLPNQHGAGSKLPLQVSEYHFCLPAYRVQISYGGESKRTFSQPSTNKKLECLFYDGYKKSREKNVGDKFFLGIG